ncbi:branched-chain amino acid ABC transporter permease [Nocardioidaceae bacterium]|nr:branched-chain amino acid ABC transporter permease [Nocardioidaceae bacterium]
MPERVSRTPHRVSATTVLLGLLLGVIAPLAALTSPAYANESSAAEDLPPTALCSISPEAQCLTGTLRTEEGVVPGVNLAITGPGTDETVTTAADGKWAFSVEQTGDFVVEVVPEGLPDGVVPPAQPTTVNVTALGSLSAVVVPVRTGDYDAELSNADYIAQSLLSGVRLGLLLALASVGLSLIYGTTGLSNFAHAEQVTLGGMLGYGLVNVAGLPLLVGGAIVVALCAFSGWFQDRIMWTPLRRRSLNLTQMLIVTIGLSLAMQYGFQYFVGARTVRVVQDNPEVVSFGPFTLTIQSIAAMAISVVVLAAVGFALLRTRIGRATRAVADNRALAAASGIDVDKVIRLVWTVSAGLAGLGGLMYALVVNGIKWDSGLQILLLLFAAVTLGGLGTAFGALVGALIIGLVVEVSPALGMPGDFKYATALLILVLVLLVRPQGILGRAQRVG